MRYIALIYGDETWFERQSGSDQAAHLQRWDAFGAALQSAGVVTGGARLMPTPSARSVRRRGGPLVSDGPSAETCPAAIIGTVEIRPVMPE